LPQTNVSSHRATGPELILYSLAVAVVAFVAVVLGLMKIFFISAYKQQQKL
jgi:hypothetical protein